MTYFTLLNLNFSQNQPNHFTTAFIHFLWQLCCAGVCSR